MVREGTRGLEVQPGGPVLAGIELGVVLPGPALKEGAIDDQLGGGFRSSIVGTLLFRPEAISDP